MTSWTQVFPFGSPGKMPWHNLLCCCSYARCLLRRWQRIWALSGVGRASCGWPEEVWFWDMLFDLVHPSILYIDLYMWIFGWYVYMCISIGGVCWYYYLVYLYKPLPQKEEGVCSIFHQNHFYYPVELKMEEAPPLTAFPWIPPSRFISSMGRMNDLHVLLGGCSLRQAEKKLLNFWKCYRDVFPSHQLFEEADSGRKPLHKCLPLYLHGDEGVSFKKNGILILTLQSAIGHGSTKMSLQNYGPLEERLPLNFLRTYETRMLIAVCPKEFAHGFISGFVWMEGVIRM